jgi:hypothetical protein
MNKQDRFFSSNRSYLDRRKGRNLNKFTIYCVQFQQLGHEKTQKTLLYSIPFNQNVKWSMSITLVVTITNRPSQGSHKPVLIIITIGRILKGTHESIKIQKHYDIWHCKQVVPTTITSLGIVFASFLYLINQIKVNKIMQHWWTCFSFHGCQGMADLCMIALDSIWVGNGDVVYHGCTLSAWVQQAKFTLCF